MNRRSSVGFDRRIDLEWLDAAAYRAAADAAPDELRAHLWNMLDGVLSGDNSGSARGKTITVLSHIWCAVPENAEALRRRASLQLATCSPDERLALHWAMMIGTYPIFSDVAGGVGRLLMLQGHFSLAHLTRRLVGVWGERSTLLRAAQRIVRSMVQWGVLRDTATSGIYERAHPPKPIGLAVGTVLIEAVLIDSEASAIAIEQLARHCARFPFALALNASHVRSASQFHVFRQGLDSDFVELHAAECLKKR